MNTTDLPLGSGPIGLAVEMVSLLRSARWEHGRIDRMQQDRFRAMVAHAREHVPMYRKMWGDLPDGTLPPPIDKPAIRQFAFEERLSAPPPSGSRRILTSGSSGEPIEVLYPPSFARWQGLLKARVELARGIKPWHRRASISFSPDGRPRSGVVALLQRRRLDLSLRQPADELARRISAFRPRSLSGHPHLLLEIGESGELSWLPRPHTWGETLDPLTRATLEHSYRHRPLDSYGTTEVGSVAWQCAEADLYHVNHEAVLVEILGGAGAPAAPGEAGEVVLTGLRNPLMPFVRYRIGDVARWSDRPCRCGYSLPALAGIEGRTFDWLTGSGGERIAPEYLWLGSHLPPGPPMAEIVRRYQVRQAESSVVTVTIELAQPAPDGWIEQIRESYSTLLNVPVEVHTGELAPSSGGKFRLIGSEIS